MGSRTMELTSDAATEPLLSSMDSDDPEGVENGEGNVREEPESPPRRRWTLWQQHRRSLSRHPATPCLLLPLIPLIAVATHYVFYFGQTAPMWKLVLHANVTVWANATSFESRAAFDTLGIPHTNLINITDSHVIDTFTYDYAVHKLWKAAHMPGTLLPRTAAVLLLLFSGVWPHLKLVLLTLTWLFLTRRRTRVLHWLSTLGKWSLADVLVVCVMVAILNLDWDVQPAVIQQGLVDELPLVLGLVRDLYSATEICDYFLKTECEHAHKAKTWTKCQSCKSFVNQALDHPRASQETFQQISNGVDTEGGGWVQLRVIGMRGIYAFCGAVILSIALSLLVDVFDVRAKRYQALPSDEPEEDEEESEELLDDAQSTGGESYEDDHIPRDLATTTYWRTTTPYFDLEFNGFAGIGVGAILIVLAAVLMGSLERRVNGAVPIILHDILGVSWNRLFSLRDLAQTVGAAKGWDYLLQATFSLFVVSGPVLRSILCLVAFVIPATHPVRRRRFLTAINFLGAFCAWEVLTMAVYMVSLLIPTITGTILELPQCLEVSPDGSCFNVEFEMQDNYAFIIVGGVLLVILAQVPLWLHERRTSG